jgi:small subunit ribosomal protein S6
MSNRYETVFIMTPVLSEEQTKETVKKFSKILTESKAKIVHDNNLGLKKLAYPIQKKSTGFYHILEFEAEGSIIDKYETEFRRDERIMRFLTVRMDKHHVAFTEKFRKRAKKSAAAKA